MLIASKCIVPRSTRLPYSRNSFIRKALVDDVTCPLCGSLSHIFSNPETATDRSPAGAPATDKNSWGWNPLHTRLLMGSWPGTLLRWLLILFNWITNTQKADVLGRAFWPWEREGGRQGGRSYIMYSMWGWFSALSWTFHSQWTMSQYVVPENIHTSTKEGVFFSLHPSGCPT